MARSFHLNPEPVREGARAPRPAVTGVQTVNSPNRAEMTAATAPALYEYFPNLTILGVMHFDSASRKGEKPNI